MAKLPTVSDVATRAGVSRQTVSNVLNSPEIVLDETRARVHRAIEDLGYRPHESARRLRTRTSSTIGIRLDREADGISGVVLDRYLHALTERLADRGMTDDAVHGGRSRRRDRARSSDCATGPTSTR